jgi:Ca2+-binding EF-hand superfamily protein
MMGMSFEPNQEDIRSWMKMTDLDGDGKVSLQDYENLIIRSLERVGIKIFD